MKDAGKHDKIAGELHDLRSSELSQTMSDDCHLSERDSAQIRRLMEAFAELRSAEQAIADASEKYMDLSAQHMRTLRYLSVARNHQETVTPGMIASYLSISPASTTKLLNRLEKGGHISRKVHPEDRRALAIEITPSAAAAAKETVGKQHARRILAAARLSPAEREVVIEFLLDTANELSMDYADWEKD